MKPELESAWTNLNVEVDFAFAEMAKRLHLEAGSAEEAEFAELFALAERTAKPKALFAQSSIESVSSDGARIGGQSFKGRMLAERLAPGQKAFPYIISCGRELDALPVDKSDPLVEFWLESLKEAALDCAFKALEEKLLPLSGMPFLNWMEPTDSEAWEIHGLAGIFKLFPGVDAVTLNEYMYMEPNKSRAGIFHGSTVKRSNCELCSMRSRCRSVCAT